MHLPLRSIPPRGASAPDSAGGWSSMALWHLLLAPAAGIFF
jgi:hypothetical protein